MFQDSESHTITMLHEDVDELYERYISATKELIKLKLQFNVPFEVRSTQSKHLFTIHGCL